MAYQILSRRLMADELAGLALEPEVESRLVIGSDWQLENGPFDRSSVFNHSPQPLDAVVQAVDLWVPEVASYT